MTSTSQQSAPVRGDRGSWTFNPTLPALLLGVIAIGGGLFFASRHLAPDPVVVEATQSAQSEQSSEVSPSEGGDTEVPTAQPVITSVTVYSWGDDGGDHPELATRMLDSDTDAYWASRYFNGAGYAQGTPVALLVSLAEPAPVTQVTVTVIGSGGEVTVVDASAGDPRSGDILATAPLDGVTTIRLAEPATVSKLGLVFNALPTDDEGRTRAKVVAISVE